MASTVWRGYISFGLISIPVRIFRAARPERVGLRRLYRQAAPTTDSGAEREVEEATETPSRISALGKSSGRSAAAAPAVQTAEAEPVLAPVKQVSVQNDNERVIADANLVKGFEYEKGRFVELEREELKSIVPKTSTGMEIQEFVQLADVDPVYFETSYYVTPEEAGEKAYALLYRAMQTTSLVAVAQFAMHGREHVVILRPGKRGLLAHTMFFENEVRADEEFHADTSGVAEKELKLAETLIQTLAGPFEPSKYKDNYREQLEAMIARKVQGLPAPVVEIAARSAPVVDIAEALRKSLANLKKPPASQGQARFEAAMPSSATTPKGPKLTKSPRRSS